MRGVEAAQVQLMTALSSLLLPTFLFDDLFPCSFSPVFEETRKLELCMFGRFGSTDTDVS